eukprot:Selendium_serpulae@DN5153_c0_g1_i2.p1
MVKGNHAIPYTRKFKKWWQRYTKVNFNASLRKNARRAAKKEAIAENGPRPVGMLRPIVHRPSFRFNMQTKCGKGFTTEELKGAGISKKVARTVGIAVDHRRRNKSVESLNLNTQRLQEYLGKLVIFPKKTKARGGLGGLPRDTPRTMLANAQSVRIAAAMPINKGSKVMEIRAPTAEEKALKAYITLRKNRIERYMHGKKAKVDPLAI